MPFPYQLFRGSISLLLLGGRFAHIDVAQANPDRPSQKGDPRWCPPGLRLRDCHAIQLACTAYTASSTRPSTAARPARTES